MYRQFFNYLIIGFLFFVFITSCSLEGGNLINVDDSQEIDPILNNSPEKCYQFSASEVMDRVFLGLEKGRTGWLVGYLSYDIEWIVEGEDVFAGTYNGKWEVMTYLRRYFSRINITEIEVVSQEEGEGTITTYTRVHGRIPFTKKSFNMEHKFYCELNSWNRITKMVITYNNYSMNLALTRRGKGNIVSNISVSAGAAGLNSYFETNIKEFIRTATVEQLRAAFDVPVPISEIPSDGTLTEVTINGIPGELMETTASCDDKIVLYIHGGAYIIGDMRCSRRTTYAIAKNTGIPVVAINYRRAPEYSFSAAPKDCITAYEGLLNTYDPEAIAIMGESTGGGLVLATMLLAKERNLPLPGAGVAISPWADLSNSSDTFTANQATEYYLTPELLNNSANMYLNGGSAEDPIASPVFGNVKGLPPIYITASSSEMLADDGATMFTKLANANSNVTIEIGAGMIHCWPNLYYKSGFPEGVATFTRIFEFVKDNLNNNK